VYIIISISYGFHFRPQKYEKSFSLEIRCIATAIFKIPLPLPYRRRIGGRSISICDTVYIRDFYFNGTVLSFTPFFVSI